MKANKELHSSVYFLQRTDSYTDCIHMLDDLAGSEKVVGRKTSHFRDSNPVSLSTSPQPCYFVQQTSRKTKIICRLVRRELHYRIRCKRRRNQVCGDNLLRQEHINFCCLGMSHGINKDRASGCKCQPTAVKRTIL